MLMRLGLGDVETNGKEIAARSDAQAVVPFESDAPATAASADQEERTRHILLSKPTQTILLVFIFASLPLFVPRLARFREMLPNPRELITFKGSETPQTGGDIPGGSPASANNTF